MASGQVAGQVMREAEDLDRFALLRRIGGQRGQHRRQLLDRAQGIVRVVARDADEHAHPRIAGGRGGEHLESGRGTARVDECARRQRDRQA